jgi:hypothetical protein
VVLSTGEPCDSKPDSGCSRAAIGLSRERIEDAYECLRGITPLGQVFLRHRDELKLATATEVSTDGTALEKRWVEEHADLSRTTVDEPTIGVAKLLSAVSGLTL